MSDGVLRGVSYNGGIRIRGPGMPVEDAANGFGILVVPFAGIGSSMSSRESASFLHVGNQVGDEAIILNSRVSPFSRSGGEPICGLGKGVSHLLEGDCLNFGPFF